MISPEIKEDIRVMKKYEIGKDLVGEDKNIVEDLCLIGFMKKGVSLKRRVVTAKTTNLGLKIIRDVIE